jgi:Toastrack DUF4097
MQRLITIAAVAVSTALAGPAQAQVYPERIPSLAREKAPRTRALWDQRNAEREEQTDRVSRTIRIGANGQIDLGNIAGDIVITRSSGPDATIEVVKTARGRTIDDAREALQLVQAEIVERGGRVEVRAQYPDDREMRARNRRNINVSVSYNVTAPPGTRISANSISGNIKVQDIQGDLTLESISGTIQITRGNRVASAKSISGNVEIVDTQADGGLAASTVSGTVAVRKVKARSLEVGSVSGPVLIDDVTCDRLNGHTVSGDLRFQGALSRGSRYELRSHSGEVRLALSGETGFELTANTFSGSVSAPDFRITVQGSMGAGRQRGLRGVFGDGSAVLDLTTFSGSIAIVKR